MLGRYSMAVAFAAGAFCLLGGHAVAKGMTEKVRNALNHMAQVIVIENNCATLESNDTRIGLMMMVIGVDLSDPAQKKYLTERVRYHGGDLEKMDEDSICLAGVVLYGPNGLNVPGLIRKK